MAKKFLSLDEQLNYLSNEMGLSYKQEDTARLMREGYFNVITNYKQPFLSEVSDYKTFEPKTTLKNILGLKDFDDALRIMFIENLMKVEQEMRAVVSYFFNKYSKGGATSWDNPASYDLSKYSPKKIDNLIRRIENDMRNNDNEDINKYIEKHQDIPSWAMLQGIAYSTFLIFVRFVKPEVRKAITHIYNTKDEYEMYTFDLVYQALDLFREIRNKCAHNERIYCFTSDNPLYKEHIYNTLVSKDLIVQNRVSLVNCLIYLKYFLSGQEYSDLIKRLGEQITLLRQHVKKPTLEKILLMLGLKSTNALKVLVSIDAPKFYTFNK